MEIQKQVRQFVVENFLYGKPNGLTDDTSFLDSGIIDSTGVLELIGYLEQTYDIQLEDHELIPDNLDSINKVKGFVDRKMNGRAIGTNSHAS